MRWSEITQGHATVRKQLKTESVTTVGVSRLQADIPVVSGPIVGIPIEEMEAWEDAQNEGRECPEPQLRRIE